MHNRGLFYEEKINIALQYVFSNLINHINIVCFISKAYKNRVDSSTRYICFRISRLFAENIAENFIVVPTFANIYTVSEDHNS